MAKKNVKKQAKKNRKKSRKLMCIIVLCGAAYAAYKYNFNRENNQYKEDFKDIFKK